MAESSRERRTGRCTDPKQSVVKQLYGLASSCAAPGCVEPLVKVVDGRRTLNTRVAHIRASAPDGPRADPYMTCEEVNDFDNLVVLCLFHAVEVDEHEADHPVSLLAEWKETQLHEAQLLGIQVALTDAELSEALSPIVASTVASAILVDLAQSFRSLRTIAERTRRGPAAVWAERDAALVATKREMPLAWNPETGERIGYSVSLPKLDEDRYRQWTQQALAEAQHEVEAATARVLEVGAGAAAAVSGSARAKVGQLTAWLERSIDTLVEAVATWPLDEDRDPNESMMLALAELDDVAAAFTAMLAGQAVDIPAPPEPEPEPEPSVYEQFVKSYGVEYEDALRFVRVDHMSYDSTVHRSLVEACPVLLNFPDSLHSMSNGLSASQNARVASAVCVNATDDEFNEILELLSNAKPEAVAALHIGYLRQRYIEAEDDHADRITALDDAFGRVGQAVLDSLADPEFWHRNGWYGRNAIAAASLGVDETKTTSALTAAIDGACSEQILVQFASVSDSMGSITDPGYTGTSRNYSRMSELPEWFPTDALVTRIRQRPDQFSSDETKRLASEFLRIYGQPE